jgi:hypothetical protein
MNPRLAIVGKPPAIDGLGVDVARHRKVTAEAFSSEQEALDWLDKRSSLHRNGRFRHNLTTRSGERMCCKWPEWRLVA